METNLKNFEKELKALETRTRILSGKRRVETLTGEDIVKLFVDLSIKEVAKHMEELIQQEKIVKAIIKENEDNCDLSFNRKFKEKDVYIIIETGSNSSKLLTSTIAIILCLCLAMFQLWPKNIKGYTVYVGYLGLLFIGGMFVLGVIRLILFLITYFAKPPGIWLFPNLFADVGFIESFIPLWSYHGVDTLPKKNK